MPEMIQQNQMPPKEQVWQIHNNATVFALVFDKFLPPLIGSTKHKNTRLTSTISEICTKSDEAFLLLVLENNWEKWMAIAKTTSQGKGVEVEENMDESTMDEQNGEEIPLLKWMGGTFHGGRNSGWLQEVKEEFAKLYNIVMKNQKVHKDMGVEETILDK
jgi:hypothetical protein